MNVSTNLTRRDLLVVSFRMLFRVRANLYFMLVLGCGFFGYMWIDEGFASTGDVLIAAFASSVGAVCGLLAGFVVSTVCLLLTADTKGGVLGMHDFSISPAGLEETTAMSTSRLAWAGIRNVMKVGGYLLIVINGHAVHVIPRRAFASQAQFDAFFEQTAAWWREAGKLRPAAA